MTDDEPGEVLASTVLHHSHEPAFNGKLPIHVGLIRLDAGPTAVCFLTEACSAGTRVRVTAQLDGMGRAVLSAAASPYQRRFHDAGSIPPRLSCA